MGVRGGDVFVTRRPAAAAVHTQQIKKEMIDWLNKGSGLQSRCQPMPTVTGGCENTPTRSFPACVTLCG